MNSTQPSFWILFAIFLLAQNFSFTFVSRARNSGSLSRHMKAALLSNGIWFINFMFGTSVVMDIVQSRYSLVKAISVVVFYTLLTMTGSLTAHYWALRTEKGLSAVGASHRKANISPDEWDEVKFRLNIK